MVNKNSRLIEFKVWLLRRGLTMVQFADAIGVKQSRLTAMLKADKITPENLERLRAVGIPEEFLPEATVRAHYERQPLPDMQSAISA